MVGMAKVVGLDKLASGIYIPLDLIASSDNFANQYRRIYCRMDILSSMATADFTRLDTSLWVRSHLTIPTSDQPWTIDTWSNHTVLILAEIHNFLCLVRRDQVFTPTLFSRWQSLTTCVETHEQHQPRSFQPLATLPADASCAENPFPSILYVNEAVSAAMQMFDLARLFLILARPERTRQERAARFEAQGEIASVYIHRIIANSVVNRHDISWANAVQLLSSAGCALVGWNARKALLQCLEDIREKTGWNTRENVKQLLDWWGWTVPLSERALRWMDVEQEIGCEMRAGEALMRMFECKAPEQRI
jgi:hypothetical protein